MVGLLDFSGNLFFQMMNNVQNVQECDATGDATSTKAGFIKIIFCYSLYIPG